jgi:Rieske Fe-S protein
LEQDFLSKNIERRQFIRQGCRLCAGIAGASLLSSFLTSCSPLPIYKTTTANRKISVPLTQFEKTNYLIVSCQDLSYDIAVVKQNDGSFKSMIMQCTHADNPVTFNGNQFNCSLHGSVYKRTGEVEKGPAERPLFALQSAVTDGQLTISLTRAQ